MKREMFSEMYISIVFKLSIEHEVFIHLTFVCVKDECK